MLVLTLLSALMLVVLAAWSASAETVWDPRQWAALKQPERDQPGAFLVGQESPMVKVFREAADFSGTFVPHVRIAAAGRERESFQLVVLPLRTSLREVRVEVSDLVHEDRQEILPAEHVTWHPVGYVQSRPSNSVLRREGWWWPDILLPAEPFDVEPGFAQPIWFTVDVPADPRPGLYRGLVRIEADGVAPQVVGLELAVRAFSLPLRGKLKTACCLSPGMWEIWYMPAEFQRRIPGAEQTSPHRYASWMYDSCETEDLLSPDKWREMYDFLLAHRLNPTTIYNSLRNGRTRVVPDRAHMEYCYERGMNATCLVNVNELPEDPEAANTHLRELEAWLDSWYEFIEDKDWPDFTWYVHGFDEIDHGAQHKEELRPSVARIYGLIGEKFPRIKRESANPFNPVHVGVFDIWTPTTVGVGRAQQELKHRQQAGDELWVYVACDVHKPYANVFLDYPGTDPRLLLWQCYQYSVTGFLYYLVNDYKEQENWNAAGPKWPQRSWNTLFKWPNYPLGDTNGDGQLVYPGPDATPLASIRLENLRDGIEDYEALVMLAELANSLQQAGNNDDLVAAAREILAVRPEISRSWTEYTEQPEVIAQARAEVDEMIEAAMRSLGEM